VIENAFYNWSPWGFDDSFGGVVFLRFCQSIFAKKGWALSLSILLSEFSCPAPSLSKGSKTSNFLIKSTAYSGTYSGILNAKLRIYL